ncbi:MAG TPA: MBL fold metallo-hydrolase [Acidobacteriota bacterium]|nr:MBL fold metallo-hydrolase [Acidobacteriota bacterium]
MTKIKFLGAAGTVSGSKYLVDTGETRFLVDCGMFQGPKKLRLLNWERPVVPPSTIDHVLLTHAHIDHSGMLPVLVREGFNGKIWTTSVTAELSEISLLDAAHLQEEDARFANKMRFTKHKPALPLFTTDDAERVVPHLRPIDYDKVTQLSDGTSVRFLDAGHILGSAIVDANVPSDGSTVRIVFSGDLGRYDALILRDPEPVEHADYLLVESTYGNRQHPQDEPVEALAAIINETARRGGMLVIPSFAVGRTQTILYLLRDLRLRKLIPDLPIFVDSPMAQRVTDVFCRHIEVFDEEAQSVYQKTGKCPILSPNVQFVHTKEESQKINDMRFPAIILSASGMATGGRILHHLKYRLPDPRNTILFVGYQAVGTRGQMLRDGAREIKIHGEMVPVRAQIRNIEVFSGHADSTEIMRWLHSFKQPPKMTFIVHGEPEASSALAGEIHRTLGWKTHIPEYLETFSLD